jgi:type I restriction enzyme, R subunit
VQFFQATRVGLTATPKAYLKNINVEKLATDDPKALEARQLRDTYHYFGCAPGQPTFRYDIFDAFQDPEGPYLCLPKIIDCRSDITTQALQEAGWSVVVSEQEETFKIRDLEKKVFTPHRNRVMCEAFLREAQRDPSGNIGKSIIFAVNQTHATSLTKILNDMKPGIAMTITSRVPEASTLAKDFRDSRRKEVVAVSVDMLSTGYNCRDLLNVVLMRPIFSPTEYIQIKGRGTRLYTFVVGNTEYEKKQFFLIDFCAVAEFFEEKYDYSAPLQLPREPTRRPVSDTPTTETVTTPSSDGTSETPTEAPSKRREIPVWLGVDRIVSHEVRVVGPNGEKVDVMTFRGSFERDLKDFVELNDDFREAVEVEDDDAIETILQERFYHRPEMFYAPDKLILSYGVPAPTPAFVYNALGRKPLPTKERVIEDTVDSIAARFNLRYGDQKWLNATAELVADDSNALSDFLEGKYNRLFARSQFRNLGGLAALTEFSDRDQVFEALRESSLVQCSRYVLQEAS